jgi:Ca2+-binding RTX toxin-like protein
MKIAKRWFGLVALLCASVPASALAQRSIQLPQNSWGFIGTIDQRSVVLVSQNGGVSCTVIPLTSGGLEETVVLVGSSGADYLYAVDRTFSYCGFWVGPAAPNGHIIGLLGEGGNDIINGGTHASVLQGGAGNDTIYSRFPFDASLFGGSGDDVLVSTSFNAVIMAGDGNDTVCANNAAREVRSMFGDTHTTGDRRCGRGTSITVGFESVNCGGPCAM